MKFAISSTAVLVALAFAGPAQAQTQVVSIGHSGPLSGPNAFAGKDNENGVRMAVEELNAKKIKVGGKATLTCPPATAYGDRGAGSAVPPNATLTFEVELLAIEK